MNLLPLVPLFGFAVVACMPLCVFRGRDFNLRWCATAAPFLISAAALVLGVLGWLEPILTLPWVVPAALTIAALAVIRAAARSHVRAPALWHQTLAPRALVTNGAYRWVRHPFYCAFLLLFLAAVTALPSAWVALVACLGALALNATARAEERELRRTFGAAYDRFIAQTGRFVPRLGAIVRAGEIS